MTEAPSLIAVSQTDEPQLSIEPLVPDYGERSTASIFPALTWQTPTELIPDAVVGADRVVVFVIDSLGWLQLKERPELAPTLSAMAGGEALTSAPSTTATALTTISTGAPPGEHGIVGYRFPVVGGVMNALRWSTARGDHRSIVLPGDVQTMPPFAGGSWHVVGDKTFIGSGFTEAYLGQDVPYVGTWHPSSLVAGVRDLLDQGVNRVYTYYDGLDHVAHVHVFTGTYFDLELAFCDWLVTRLIDALPSGTALVITADHGQVEAPQIVPVSPECVALTTMRSGEARFRWLHTKAGATEELAAAASEAHGDQAWIRTREQVIDEGWFGANVSPEAQSRLGDVALVAHAPMGFDDPGEPHTDRLVGRHGSLTAAEMLVPVLHAVV